MYDVIVAGAGPAGSTAAMVLAQAGLRTLLIDREGFPREKACGDAVPAHGFHILNELGMPLFSPEDVLPMAHVFVQGPRGRSLKLALTQKKDSNSAIVSRYVFDHALYKHALASGAEFCQMAVSAPLLEEGQVVGVTAKQGKTSETFRSRVVIAADGATSVIARALGGAARPDEARAVALRGYVESDVDLEPTMDLVFLRDIQPGYAWFFPMSKRRANIGVGMRADTYRQLHASLPDMLDSYMQSSEVKRRVGSHAVTDLKAWQVPLNILDQRRTYDGALLAGDAGGFVDPLTGAGIYQAILTGKRAAEAAVAAIQAGDVSAHGLALYDQLWRRDLGTEIKRSTLLYHLIARFPPVMDAMILLGRSLPPLVPLVIGKI